MAALPAGQTDTWIGRFYGRKRAHLGAPKAITATAHKIACVVYHMLKYQEEFLPLEVAVYELKAQERRMRNCENRLKSSAANSQKESKLRNGYLEEGRQRVEASNFGR